MDNNISLIERYVTAQLAPLKRRIRRIEAQQQLEILGMQENIEEISERLARLEADWHTVRLVVLVSAICLALIMLLR